MNNAQENKKRNSEAKIRANNRYRKKTYVRIAVDIRPEEALLIREKAQAYKMSLARLIVEAVKAYSEDGSNTHI